MTGGCSSRPTSMGLSACGKPRHAGRQEFSPRPLRPWDRWPSPPRRGSWRFGFRTGEITLLDLDSGQERARIAGHQGNVSCLVFGGDGAVFASGGADGAVRLWETASGHLLATLSGHRCAVLSLAFSPDGKTLASAGSVSGELKLWDVSTTCAGSGRSRSPTGL